MLTDQTFSEMDLQSIGQNLDLAKTRLDHILLDAQTLLSDAETQIHAASYFDLGSFRRSIMQRLNMKTPSAPVILYDASGTPLCIVGRSDATLLRSTALFCRRLTLSALETPEISYPPARLETASAIIMNLSRPWHSRWNTSRRGNCPQGCLPSASGWTWPAFASSYPAKGAGADPAHCCGRTAVFPARQAQKSDAALSPEFTGVGGASAGQ